MGHPVNPISLRLGVVRSWDFLSNSLEDKLEYSFFNFYNFNILNFFKRVFDLRAVEKMGLVFSHMKCFVSYKRQYFLIFYYDGVFESGLEMVYKAFKLRHYQKKFLKLFYKRVLKIFRRFVSYFLKTRFPFYYNNFNLNFLNWSALIKFFLLKSTMFIFFFNSSNNFFWLKLLEKFFFYVSKGLGFSCTFKIKYLFKENKYLFSLRRLLRKKKFFNFLRLNFFSIKNLFKFKFYNFYKGYIIFSRMVFRKKFVTVKFFIKFIRNFILTTFLRLFLDKYKLILFPSNFKNISFGFKSVRKFEISANVISKYICVKLLQRYSMREVVNPIMKDLSSNHYIDGFKISCCGRFSKKEIATFFWRKIGKVSFNNFSSYIDYSFNEVILKYSICGIKIWIQRRKSSFRRRSWFRFKRFFVRKKKFRRKFLDKIKKAKNFEKNKSFKKSKSRVFFNKLK